MSEDRDALLNEVAAVIAGRITHDAGPKRLDALATELLSSDKTCIRLGREIGRALNIAVQNDKGHRRR